jgi:putative transposase
MPRKSRIDVAGSIQHIIIRGIERSAIFKDSQNHSFLNRLDTLLTDATSCCYAWALMQNTLIS